MAVVWLWLPARRTEFASVDGAAGAGPILAAAWLWFSASGTEFPSIDGAAGAGPALAAVRLWLSASGAESSGIDSAAGASPAARRGLGILHLCGIGRRSSLHKAAACLHPHIHAHKTGHGAGAVRAGCFHAPRHGSLDIAFPDGGVT